MGNQQTTGINVPNPFGGSDGKSEFLQNLDAIPASFVTGSDQHEVDMFKTLLSVPSVYIGVIDLLKQNIQNTKNVLDKIDTDEDNSKLMTLLNNAKKQLNIKDDSNSHIQYIIKKLEQLKEQVSLNDESEKQEKKKDSLIVIQQKIDFLKNLRNGGDQNVPSQATSIKDIEKTFTKQGGNVVPPVNAPVITGQGYHYGYFPSKQIKNKRMTRYAGNDSASLYSNDYF